MSEPVKKTVDLYDSTVHIQFNSAARNRYVVMNDGHSPTGVTTILGCLAKEGLMLWPMYEALNYIKDNSHTKLSTKDGKSLGYAVELKTLEEAEKAHTKKSDTGKSVGTEVHTAIEVLLNGGIASSGPEAYKAIETFRLWFNQNKPKVLATERIVYSKELDYAGTYDALLEIDGKVILADVKTTNASRTAPLGIYPEMFLQLAAYARAHHEENPLEQISDVMVIRVGKDGILNTLRASELGLKLDELQDTFVSLVRVYKAMQPLKKLLTERKV